MSHAQLSTQKKKTTKIDVIHLNNIQWSIPENFKHLIYIINEAIPHHPSVQTMISITLVRRHSRISKTFLSLANLNERVRSFRDYYRECVEKVASIQITKVILRGHIDKFCLQVHNLRTTLALTQVWKLARL